MHDLSSLELFYTSLAFCLWLLLKCGLIFYHGTIVGVNLDVAVLWR